MSQGRAVLILLLVGASLGCVHQAPAFTPSSVGSLTGPPGKGEVDLVFHGLVSFVFHKDGSVQSVFLTPASEEHIPLCAVDTSWIHSHNASKPDWIATGTGDTGLAVWKFLNARHLAKDVSDKTLDVHFDAPDDTDANFIRIKWVPSMDDIFGGVAQAVDTNAIDPTKAVSGTWSLGTMRPVFDRDDYSKDPWWIGKRTGINNAGLAVAEGVKIRLELAAAAAGIAILIKREGFVDEDKIIVKGGGTVFFSDFPHRIPGEDEDMAHFDHFYDLLLNLTSRPQPMHQAGPPNPYPARCAPSLVYPPVE